MLQFSADTGLKVSLGVFFLSSFFLHATYNTTFAFDRPINTTVLICFLTGAVFLVFGYFVPSASRPSSPISKRSRVPLADQFELASPSSSRSSRSSFSSPILAFDEPTPLDVRSGYWYKLGGLLIICCLRVELFRRISLNSECAPAGYSYALPFTVSLYDYWRYRRLLPIEEYVSSHRFKSVPVQVAESIYRRCFYYLTKSHFRGVIAAALISLGGYSASSFLAGSQSTYICPLSLHAAFWMRLIGYLSLLFDSLILMGLAELFEFAERTEARRNQRALMSLGAGLLAIAFIWTIIAIFVEQSRPEHSGQPFLDLEYTRSAFGQALLVLFFIVSAWQMLPSYGVLGITILTGFMFIYFPAASTLFLRQMPFPFISLPHSSLPLIASTAGAVLFLLGRIFSQEEAKSLYRANIALQITFIVLCIIGLIFASTKHHISQTHPIDLLIHKATLQFDRFFEEAAKSTSLEEAVVEYRNRYNQHPPPGFDKWYEYATYRSSVVIDDFDELHKNLLPFRSVPPQQLREMTQKLATNPFNDLGGISIRDGKPRVQEGIKPTHAWMVQGAAQMIEKFSEYLPDMDLVFNLNDEPRVAVPWEKIWPLKRAAKEMEFNFNPESGVVDTWSVSRKDGWGPIEPADSTNQTIFTDGAWRGVFDPYVSALCPPSSKARTRRVWNRHNICLSCVDPHSMGQFPKHFEVASDICHQPDLAFLHGLLISPASFKVSQDLVPIFSQSALKGFNDILFPSPWNYMDKVKYAPTHEHPDPEYDDKDNSLYWIGGTSEGMSRFGEWKGMPRQRFAHLINNNTDNKVSVLLETGPKLYKYEIMNGNDPSEKLGLRADVHLADSITRCGDCDEQEAELGLSEKIDFQQHWTYRFLFDLDGAGFSGRFLPFLQSHSVPFKTGLFRQWFDSRLISWFHFVPVDIRFHGFWSTLAYFAGISGPLDDHSSPTGQLGMKAHDEDGWWIAEQGRKWSEIALRKEDMEIYFFRLLLEWGRLTDDQREELGFKP
ncbi:hypothetical protein N7466_003688 [Penicillium verhagenii]|uniref:uncharacterized protein n=1 Tax=Penicillium verhagenii TaxID=1562060 RepID=UPI00254588DD|nr:uncharacterized protein N7466_003688 [Penicillium verhagenii]KAJ5934141.1 hypothetical protein N7466_003688 [Penicillium verhagenii]